MADEGVEVSYHPGPGDPQETTWRGVTFKAGQRVRITDAAHLGAMKGNRFFCIHEKDEKPADGGKERTADDQRREFIQRIEGEKTVEGVIRAFAAERRRREDEKAATGDLDQLQSHLADRITEMRMREGMGTRQVAELWMKYGMCER